MEEVTDEPLYRDRVCGIDIGKAGMVATIRVPSDKDPARRAAETRSFGTTKREVLALADWLRSWQVPAVVMEATGDYWKGPFYRLEAEGFECVLADARQVKHLPGRPKRDPSDSRWLVTDLPAIWNDPATPARERKRIARLLLTDVTITRTRDTITAHIRLPAGQHHTLTMPVPPTAAQLRKTPAEAVAAVDELLDHHTHAEIAGILNTRGLTTGEGRPFHRLIVRNIRDEYQLRSREQRLRDQGLLTLHETAAILGVFTGTVKIWYHAGIVSGQRYNDKGQILYHPPGPNPPTPHQGTPLHTRPPAQTREADESTGRGAV